MSHRRKVSSVNQMMFYQLQRNLLKKMDQKHLKSLSTRYLKSKVTLISQSFWVETPIISTSKMLQLLLPLGVYVLFLFIIYTILNKFRLPIGISNPIPILDFCLNFSLGLLCIRRICILPLLTCIAQNWGLSHLKLHHLLLSLD